MLSIKELKDNNYWSSNNRRLIFIISRKLKEECTLRNGVEVTQSRQYGVNFKLKSLSFRYLLS
jgi:hypothetical protein